MDAHPRFPACCVEFPPSVGRRRAAFYLATEEFIATTLPEDNYLFSWVLAPTVVMGRHQMASQEINLDFCRREGIDVVRRKSGGGCIFADTGNVMFSLITGVGAVEPIFEEYAHAVAGSLTQIGIPATVSGRNDILLADGTKICGNAFYHLAQRNIVHGTMLYDTDHRLMEGALTPDTLKLKAAGVKSVRSRTGLIKNVWPHGVGKLREELHQRLCDRHITLSEDEVKQIEHLETGYYEPAYLYGNTGARHDVNLSERIEGCGRVEMAFSCTGGVVTDMLLSGDFFGTEDATNIFRETFIGLPCTAASLQAAAANKHPEKHIRGLSAAALKGMLEKL